jgi:hypothetical protein
MNEEEKLYRVFYINNGKFFLSIVEGLSVRQAITKHHESFKKDCLWVTFDVAIKLIKHNRHFPTVWGIVDKDGKEKTVGKFDGILKNGR